MELKQSLLQMDDLTEQRKLDAVADIDTIETQLAKAEPIRSVTQGAWDGVKKLDTVLGLGEKVTRVAGLLAAFL